MARNEELSDGVWRWGRRFEHKWLDPIVEDALTTFRNHKCYEMDFNRFWDNELDTSAVDDCLYKWTIQGGIISQIENEEDCREILRRERMERAKCSWGGGALGGGITAALKGAAKAELLNYAGAAIVGIFNKIERRRTVRDAVIQAVLAFRLFQLELIDSIHETIIGFAKAVTESLDYLVDDGVEYETGWVTCDRHKIDALFANLKKGLVPVEDQKPVALEVLKGNPNNEFVYSWLMHHFPEDRESIMRVANFFCVNIDEKSAKTATWES